MEERTWEDSPFDGIKNSWSYGLYKWRLFLWSWIITPIRKNTIKPQLKTEFSFPSIRGTPTLLASWSLSWAERRPRIRSRIIQPTSDNTNWGEPSIHDLVGQDC